MNDCLQCTNILPYGWHVGRKSLPSNSTEDIYKHTHHLMRGNIDIKCSRGRVKTGTAASDRNINGGTAAFEDELPRVKDEEAMQLFGSVDDPTWKNFVVFMQLSIYCSTYDWMLDPLLVLHRCCICYPERQISKSRSVPSTIVS